MYELSSLDPTYSTSCNSSIVVYLLTTFGVLGGTCRLDYGQEDFVTLFARVDNKQRFWWRG